MEVVRLTPSNSNITRGSVSTVTVKSTSVSKSFDYKHNSIIEQYNLLRLDSDLIYRLIKRIDSNSLEIERGEIPLSERILTEDEKYCAFNVVLQYAMLLDSLNLVDSDLKIDNFYYDSNNVLKVIDLEGVSRSGFLAKYRLYPEFRSDRKILYSGVNSFLAGIVGYNIFASNRIDINDTKYTNNYAVTQDFNMVDIPPAAANLILGLTEPDYRIRTTIEKAYNTIKPLCNIEPAIISKLTNQITTVNPNIDITVMQAAVTNDQLPQFLIAASLIAYRKLDKPNYTQKDLLQAVLDFTGIYAGYITDIDDDRFNNVIGILPDLVAIDYPTSGQYWYKIPSSTLIPQIIEGVETFSLEAADSLSVATNCYISITETEYLLKKQGSKLVVRTTAPIEVLYKIRNLITTSLDQMTFTINNESKQQVLDLTDVYLIKDDLYLDTNLVSYNDSNFVALDCAEDLKLLKTIADWLSIPYSQFKLISADLNTYDIS